LLLDNTPAGPTSALHVARLEDPESHAELVLKYVRLSVVPSFCLCLRYLSPLLIWRSIALALSPLHLSLSLTVSLTRSLSHSLSISLAPHLCCVFTFIISRYHTHWPAEICIRQLESSLMRLAPDSVRRKPVASLLERLRCFDAVLRFCPRLRKSDPSGPQPWRFVADKCQHDLPAVISALLEAQQLPCAEKLLDLFGPSIQPATALASLREQVQEAGVRTMLEAAIAADAAAGPDSAMDLHAPALRQLLQLAPADVKIAATLLTTASSPPLPLSARLALIQYLQRVVPEGTPLPSAVAADKLERWALGLGLLLRLPRHLQEPLRVLQSEPHLLVETLVMNERLPELSTLLPHLSADAYQLSKACLHYARKALLDGPFAVRVLPPQPELFCVLTGEAAADDRLRATHRYPSAPNMFLFKQLLELSKAGPDVTGELCLDVRPLHLPPYERGNTDRVSCR
jgi:hypothetical protein